MDKKLEKPKGYGFVSFGDPNDYLKCMKEMQNQYVGNRPVMLKKSKWRDRLDAAKIEEEKKFVAEEAKKQRAKTKRRNRV